MLALMLLIMLTLSNKYHLDPFYSNRLLNLKLKILNVLSIVKKTLSIRYSKTGLFESINKDLGKIYLMTEGLLKVVVEFDKSQAKEEHILAIKALKRFTKIYSILASANFFGSSETNSLADSILANLYSAEFILRNTAYEDIEIDPHDKELQEFASSVSINSAISHSNALQPA